MAKKTALLEQMAQNPGGNWQIADILKVAQDEGLECRPPKRGSHYTISSTLLAPILTVPYNRPIKVVYIRQLVSFARAHRAAKLRQQGTTT
jgi:hypothetical protein